MKTIEELESDILNLQGELNKYNKLYTSSERLGSLVKERAKDLAEVDEKILINNDILLKQNNEIDDNNIIIENIDAEILKLTTAVDKLGRDFISTNKYISELETKKIDKKDEIKKLQEDFDKKVEEIEEHKKTKTKELEVELNSIKNNIYKDTEDITKIKKDILNSNKLYTEAKDNLKEQNIKIQTNNTDIGILEKEKEVLIEKIIALKDEITLMLKEGKELSMQHKVVKSRATRLDRINRNFNL